MKAFIPAVLAILATSAPAFAEPEPNQSLVVQGERAVCTRVQLRGASRISFQRLCRTPAEWRQRLGPDWQQILAGNTPEADLDTLDLLARTPLETGGIGGFRGGGGPR